MKKTCISLISFMYCFSVLADVRLPKMFSDNMVLQRNAKISVWGWADSGEKITIQLNKQTKTTVAGKGGKWKIYLAPEKAGGPFVMNISGKNKITYSNILIGEVWVCSGQSNMEMPLEGWGKIKDFEKEIAQADFPKIRLLQVQQTTSNVPLDDINTVGGQWLICAPSTIADFSATAYFFARDVYQHTGIPIGLIHASWGGTIAEAWTSSSTLKTMPDFVKRVKEIEKETGDQSLLVKKYESDMSAWRLKVDSMDTGLQKGKALYADVSYDISSWKTMSLPGIWEIAGYDNLDGIVWYTKKIMIPDNWFGKDIKVSLGPIDDEDITYFNGVKIGELQTWNEPRLYTIPAALVKGGENLITIRVKDNGGGGGLYGDASQLYLKTTSGDSISLAGKWSYKIAVDFKNVPGMPVDNVGPNRPTVLYNAMIHPIIPYAIRGAIWYQGESNADRAFQYRSLFPAMVKDWRTHWQQGNFPFYFVQLANYTEVKDQPDESDWAELREAQKHTLSLPNTGMAVTIDIGEAKDIHPKNKQEVGHRLALIARAKVYGEKIIYYGPVYQSFAIENNKISIIFDKKEGGLKTSENKPLKGFAIAGADKKFYWADARIEGNKIIVWSTKVIHPVAVRYAWANNPICNLINTSGLPASPFRTDNWPMITAGKK